MQSLLASVSTLRLPAGLESAQLPASSTVSKALLLTPLLFRTTETLLRVLFRPPRRLASKALDPVGAPEDIFKTLFARFMVFVAQTKEVMKSKRSVKELEGFHPGEDHDFFNESYYFNGCDAPTNDRIVTRISHRGRKGKRSYVFLLLDIAGVGELALEQDIEATSTPNPTALGLEYHCLEPMKKWRIVYKGKMTQGCIHPRDAEGFKKAALVDVELDLVYDVDSPLFWYMRDDHPDCLAGNLSQEYWGLDFVKSCLRRTVDHAHYEDFGRLTGQVKVGNSFVKQYDFGTFRDHSWDIRRWATMDSLLILLIALKQPLILADGVEYWYVDLTLVNMPGNIGGVARYSTGYALGKPGTPILSMVHGTSVLEIPNVEGPKSFYEDSTERYPTDSTKVVMTVDHHPRSQKKSQEFEIAIDMSGAIRRTIYWPDEGAFKVYEDSMNFTLTCGNQTVEGYGTRQSGFRVGPFDPSLGGCG